jgi:iron complex transport system permease protein
VSATTVAPTPARGRGPARPIRPFRRRAVIVTVATGALALALFLLTLGVGSTVIPPWQVVASLLHLTDAPLIDIVVRELRLPTALTGLAVGLAFGLSGPLFQRMLGNPLASPDFVGISSGSALFACAAIISFQASGLAVAGASLVGGLLSAGLIYVLAWRGGVRGFRFILIGIGVSAIMESLVGYLLSRATVWDARAAMTWLIGSVGQAGPDELAILCGVLVLAVPVGLLLERQLRSLELGDDAASALGTRVEPARLGIVAIVIVLIGCATAVAGPIPFVALMAGPIAARLFGPAPGGLLASAFIGASLVMGADLVASHLLPTTLPTGVVTGLVGAPYLLWLLATANREGRGE